MSASRRLFLGASAATAAVAGWSKPTRAALAPGESKRTDGVTNLALIGCGGQGRHNLSRMFDAAKAADVGPVRAIAVCDADSARTADAVALANALNGGGAECLGFDNHAALLQAVGADLDAVIVATPDHQHAPASIAAADAGLAVYCEKPLANSVADCDAILAAARRNDVLLQVGSHERSNDRVRRACELIRGGALGALKEVVLQMPTEQEHHRAVAATTVAAPTVPPPSSLDYAMWLGDSTAAAPGPATWPDMKAVDPQLPGWMPQTGPHFWWRFVSAFGAGEITDRGAHILDIAQLATGRDDAEDWRPTSVTGTGGDRPGAFYDAPMRYDFRVTFSCGPDYVGTTEGERGLRFVGERGEVFVAVHGGATTAEPAALLDAATDVDLGRTASHHANFLRSLAGEETLFAPVQAGHRTAVLCHLINDALRAG
ncbi:Gfo/Idh/MocA family protein [Alienimonas californiensis]|uniref:Inositol 2-dehydrogenase n=1 Tax=Alienimonas californiensis TaxID=2527989 RepID=A0A517P3S8_9PLAN|nr:Gfo/Idh/MocA family oxidoreductase [Alienimonas californiensis]QDT14013.1 Inositol 2-dehydrogenase [Alienimonas californiensis]